MAIGATGYQLKLRLFLEGIEVPVIGAQVQMNLNAPATASIQVVPTDRILDIKPRTMVHLFFWDYTKDLPDAPTLLNEGNDVTNQQENVVAGQDSAASEARMDNYKLLFGGEVVGLAMSQNAMARQAVLQCADWSTYWDTSYQSMLDVGSVMGNKSAMWAGGSNVFNNLLSSHSGVMSNYLRKSPRTEGLGHVKGLMGGIIALLEVMGGVPKHTSGINDFFTIAELKNHLMQQITAEQNDNTAQRLFSDKSFSAWLNSRTTSMGQLVSFRDMLKLLFHWVYYEVVPVSTPYYVPAVTGSSKEVVKKVRVKDTQDLTPIQRRVVRDLIRTAAKYNGSLGVERTLSNQTRVIESRESLRIRNKLGELLVGGYIQKDPVIYKQGGGGTRAKAQERSLLTGKFVEQEREREGGFIGPLTSVRIKTNNLTPRAVKAVKAAVTATESIKPITLQGPVDVATLSTNDPVGKQYVVNQKVWVRIHQALLKILGVKGRQFTRRRTFRKKGQVDRLQTQIFRPDCFFVPPPKCNVWFPDMYTDYQFQRNFMQEVTRLKLTTGLQFLSGKGSGFFNRSNFAPEMKEVKALAASQGNRGIRTLLPWEKHTGILPKFEHISEVNYRANQRQKKLNKDVKGQAASFGQRAANFNFFKYRFSPRTLTLNGKFNPFFAPGFPALIITKPFILDTKEVSKSLIESGVDLADPLDIGSLIANIGSVAAYFKAPTHFLGMPAALSHMVDQKGGVTAVTLTHARQHRITDDDFLRIWSAEVSRKKSLQIKETVLDSQELLAKGDYKGLRILIDATPQNIIEQMTQGLPQDAVAESTSGKDVNQTDDYLGTRATGAPTPGSNINLAPFLTTTSDAATLLVGSSAAQVKSVLTKGAAGTEGLESKFGLDEFLRLRGGTAKATLAGTGAQIDIPSPYGNKVQPAKKGPLGGKITQVQVLGDSVVEVSAVDMSGFVRNRKQKRKFKSLIKGKKKTKKFFMWRRAIIHEEVKTRLVRPIPVEESIRPPWFSPMYSNMFIGPQIYQKFFGTGSIVDQSLFMTPEGGALANSSSERDEILAQIRAADGDSVKISSILEENEGKTISDIPSTEQAVDALAFIYGEVRRQDLDVQRFIANYTSRPIATMRNILGSLDLEYVRNGNVLEVASGAPGFHSSAIAPFGELLGILDNPDQELPRLRKTGKKSPISKDLDPRPERRKAILDYADEVSTTKGSLGAGLVG